MSGVLQIPLPQLNTNIDPNAVTFALNVNGAPSDSTIFQANGRWFAQWDTFTTPNGTYDINLKCHYNQGVIDQDDIINGASVSVYVNNAITLSTGSKRCENQLNVQALVNTPASSYTINVYDQVTGNCLTTLSGPVVGNCINTSWNLGNQGIEHPLCLSVALGELAPQANNEAGNESLSRGVALVEQPLPQPQPQPKPPRPPVKPITIPKDKDKNPGLPYTIATGWNVSSATYMTALENVIINDVVNNLDTLEECYTLPQITTFFPPVIYQALPRLCGRHRGIHGYCWDPCWPVIMSFLLGMAIARVSLRIQMVTSRGAAIYATNISTLLGNVDECYGYSREFRLTTLYSCFSFSQPLCNAFGVTFGDFTTSAQYVAQLKKMRAFVGWEAYSLMPGSGTNDIQQAIQVAQVTYVLGPALDQFHSDWMNQKPIIYCVADFAQCLFSGGVLGSGWGLTQDFNGDGIPDVLQWNIAGCYDLSTFNFMSTQYQQ